MQVTKLIMVLAGTSLLLTLIPQAFNLIKKEWYEKKSIFLFKPDSRVMVDMNLYKYIMYAPF